MLSSELTLLAGIAADIAETSSIASSSGLLTAVQAPDLDGRLPAALDIEKAAAEKAWEPGASCVEDIAGCLPDVSSWLLSCVSVLTSSVSSDLTGIVDKFKGIPSLGFLSSSLSAYPAMSDLATALESEAWETCSSYLAKLRELSSEAASYFSSLSAKLNSVLSALLWQ